MFVSGLPPTFNSEQLRSHFGNKFHVTDAHVLEGRRIGFVGFRDADTAQNAVKYFNKSFIRMSKISVDLARAVEVQRNATGHAVPLSDRDSNRKRKRDLTDEGREASTTLQRSSRSTGKQSDNPKITAHVGRPSVEPATLTAPKASALKITHGTDQPLKTSGDTGASSSISDKHDLAQTSHTKDLVAPSDTENAEPSASDNDWLRGKTSRLLDIMDPEELQDRTTVPTAEETNRPADVVESDEQSPDEVEPQTPEDIHTAGRVEVLNGRLFVRNLPFTADEQALREKFSDFGKLDEVSSNCFLALATSVFT